MSGMNGLQMLGIVALIGLVVLLLEFGLSVFIGKFIKAGRGKIRSFNWNQPAQWDETHMRDRLHQALDPGVKWGTRVNADGDAVDVHPTLSDFDRHVSEAMDVARGH